MPPKRCKKARDEAWNHGVPIPNPDNNPKLANRVMCNYCKQPTSGGITRLKHHLAGTHHGVSPCPHVPQDVRDYFLTVLNKLKELKEAEESKIHEMGKGTIYFGSSTASCAKTNNDGAVSGPSRGAMDKYVTKGDAPIQTTLPHAYKKTERKDVCKAIGRFFYANALSFNLCNSPYFRPMVEAIGNYGRGLKPPSYHEMRTWILKDEVEATHQMLHEFKKTWPKVGCSIMCDGWTDGKRRSLLNFLVNSSSGTMFLKSVDISSMEEKSAVNLEKIFVEVINEVGKDYVVQFITDNAANFKAAGKMLERRNEFNLFWTPCTAHCLDLILEDIGEMNVFKSAIDKAKNVAKFVYNHAWVLNLMRKHTNNKEILRPAVTRFATSYLTLHSMLLCKNGLKAMFLSPEFRTSRYSNSDEAINASNIVIIDDKFWNSVVYAVKVAMPIVKVLRLVDGDDRPPMGFIYEAMDRAKESIASNLDNIERRYKPIWEIVDKRWNDQLHHPLHTAGYFLNPHFQYDDNFKADGEIMNGFYDCVDKLIADVDTRRKISRQQDAFVHARGLFGREMAIATRKEKSPADWWSSFGHETPELATFAMRILNLTCSASGCERNWSTFSMVHSKRRNKLEQQKMNALVFVMYNMKLKERHLKRSANQDPISLDHIDSDDEWIMEKENPLLPDQPNWLVDDSLLKLNENLDIGGVQAPRVPKEASSSKKKTSITYKRKGKEKKRAMEVEEEEIDGEESSSEEDEDEEHILGTLEDSPSDDDGQDDNNEDYAEFNYVNEDDVLPSYD